MSREEKAFYETECHGCGKSIPVLIEVVNIALNSKRYSTPVCRQAPLICSVCRTDKTKFAAARAAMELHLEDEAHIEVRRAPL